MKYYPPRFLFRRYELLKRIETGVSFLEIGPGSLNLTGDLLKFFEKGLLVDYNSEIKQYFKAFQSSESSKMSLVIADFIDFTINDYYDTVVACEVLEHIEEETVFLSKTYKILEANGQLILSVPARKKYWSVHDEGVGHLRRYERKELVDLLQTVGFTNIEVVSYGFPFVNILRFPRILLAKQQKTHNSSLSKKAQTQESGLSQYRVMPELLGFLCNKYTIAPMAAFSSLFNKFAHAAQSLHAHRRKVYSFSPEQSLQNLSLLPF